MKDSIYRYNLEQFFPQPSISIERQAVASTTASGDYKLQPKTHIVKSGESLSLIARKYRTTASELAKINKMNVKVILAGFTMAAMLKPDERLVLVGVGEKDYADKLAEIIGLARAYGRLNIRSLFLGCPTRTAEAASSATIAALHFMASTG